MTAPRFGLDEHRFHAPQSPVEAIRRRVSGRYPVDAFGLDPQLCDLTLPFVRRVVRVELEGAERLPSDGPAALVCNRGVGIGEPLAMAVAVEQATGRRVRFVGDVQLGPLRPLARRLGAIGEHPADLAALLRAGHVVAVPLAPTWLRTEAGPPPLAACAAMMGFTVHPVAVSPGGPLGTPIRPWKVRVGAHVALDSSYEHGDPLAAAELGDAARDAVHTMLTGGDPADTPRRADLAG